MNNRLNSIGLNPSKLSIQVVLKNVWPDMPNQFSAALVKKVFSGMITGVGSIGIKQVLSILFIPLMISKLGFDTFSLFMLIVGLQEASLFLDFGFSQTMITLLAKTEDEVTSNKQQILGLSYLLFVAAALVLCLLVVTALPWVTVVFNIPYHLHSSAELLFTLMAVEAVLLILLTFYQSVLMSLCHHSVNNTADTIYHIAAFGLGGLLLWLNFGLMGLLFARLLGAVVRAVIIIQQTVKIAELNVSGFLNLTQIKQLPKITGKFFSLSRHAFVNNISIVLSHKIDTIVIGLFLPIAAVGVYDIIFRLLGSAQQICIKMSEMFLTVFSSVSKGDDNNATQSLFYKTSGINQLIISTLIILIMAFYPTLLTYLTDKTLTVQETWVYLALAIPIVWSSVMQIPASVYLFTNGNEEYLSKSSIVTALCNVVLSLLLVKPLGLAGVILGTFIPQIIQHQFYLIRYAQQQMQADGVRYVLEVYWRGLAPVVLSAMVLGTFLYTSWVMSNLILVLLVSLLFVVTNVTLWTLWHGETFENILIALESYATHFQRFSKSVWSFVQPKVKQIYKIGVMS